MTPALCAYLAIGALADPMAPLVLRRRLAAGKEDADRLGERLGHPTRARPDGPLAWFHAASVGEGLSLLPLVERVREVRGDVSVLVTTGTVTSARLLGQRLPAGALHQYAPVDTRAPVRRFLAHWRPDLAVWIESEIWPRLLVETARRGVPAVLLNARLGARSRARWARLPRTAAQLFGIFDHVQAQDAGTAEALRGFGVAPERLDLAGSFKSAAAPLPCDLADLDALRDAVAGRTVWTAASTHPGEEDLALSAQARIVAQRPDALLILVPRHPARGDEIAALVAASGLPAARRRDGPPPRDASVYLADTLGELGLWYRLAPVAYVGGSQGGVGGHNPYEPVALGTAVVHGPDTANFADVYRDLDAAGAACVVRTSEELAETVLRLADGDAGRAIAARAHQVVTGGDALERAVSAVLSRLP